MKHYVKWEVGITVTKAIFGSISEGQSSQTEWGKESKPVGTRTLEWLSGWIIKCYCAQAILKTQLDR